ncbi:hypothetical protein CBS101457_001608 [Exobasidium rhododendri]|nr:hypothetical protein CBS101457_001608 [Exobasidium rhododendri]
MQSFDRPTGRIKAVYGRTKGLVARRKALAAKTFQIDNSSESTDLDSDDNVYDPLGQRGKENVRTTEARSGIAKAKAFRRPLCKSSSSANCGSESEEEEERVLPARRSTKKQGGKDAGVRSRQKSTDGKKEMDDLIKSIDVRFNITTQPKCSAETHKLVEIKRSDEASLLDLCGQTRPDDFSAFLTRLEEDVGCKRWHKIGEASYSEVYGLSSARSVVKIIPLQSSSIGRNGDMPEQSLLKDVHREVQLTRSLSKVADGFVKMYSAKVVKGKYPSRLLNARAARPQREEDTNPCPALFPAHQSYAALTLENGGKDLESVEDLSWNQAVSIFYQVVKSLASAEAAHQFEHRDLHWGNVVIAQVDVKSDDDRGSTGLSCEESNDPNESGVKATIIDYTLSRAKIGDTLIANSFDDDSLFEGQGDMQFDVYRQMKQETKGDWSGYYPHTNVLWLNYLASKLIDEKHIPNPKRRSQLGAKANNELESRNFLMETKRLLMTRRFDSASAFLATLSAITL